MADSWKQIWSDIVHAISGAPPAPETPRVEATVAPIEQEPVPSTPATEPAPITPEPLESVPPMAEKGSSEILEPPQPAVSARGGWVSRIVTVGILIVIVGYVGWPWLAPFFAPQPPAPNVAATFKGGQITTEQLQEHLALLVPKQYQDRVRNLENLRALAEEMVVDELMRRWAAERKVDADETFRHTMQHISESINLDSLHAQLHKSDIPVQESEIQAYYQKNQSEFGGKSLDEVRQQIRDKITSEREPDYVKNYLERLKANASISQDLALLDTPEPSEDDLRRYYDANREQFKLSARVVVDEIQIPIGGDESAARRQADAARLRVQSGATFVQAAQEITGTRVLTATTVVSGTRGADWTAAVIQLSTGALSDVLRDSAAFSIVRLRERQAERIPALSEVRAQVLAGTREQKAEEWFKSNGEKTLFTIKGQRYSLGQFYQEYKELPPDVRAQYQGTEGRKKLAAQLIERLLIVEDSTDRLLDVQNKAELDETRLDVLKQMFHQENVDDKIKIGDEQIKKFYDENKSQFVLPPKARIRYLRIELGQTADEEKRARDRANEAYRKLVPGPFQTGAEFGAIAREYSEDQDTAARGGELDGWVGEGVDTIAELVNHPFHRQVLALQVNQISQPFVYGDSLYIVQVIQRSEPQPITIDQAKPMIQDELTHRQHDDLLAKLSDQLAQQAEMVIYDSTLRALLTQLAPPATPTK